MRKSNEKCGFIAAPTDVHFVLMCHILVKNDQFVDDQIDLFGKKVCHKAIFLPEIKLKNDTFSVKYFESKTEHLWKNLYESEPFENLGSKRKNKPRFNRPTEIEKRLVKIVIDIWENQTEIIWKFNLPHFKSIQFLYSSFLRYQMLLSFKLSLKTFDSGTNDLALMHFVHSLDTKNEKNQYKEVNLSKLCLKWKQTFGDLKHPWLEPHECFWLSPILAGTYTLPEISFQKFKKPKIETCG